MIIYKIMQTNHFKDHMKFINIVNCKLITTLHPILLHT